MLENNQRRRKKVRVIKKEKYKPLWFNQKPQERDEKKITWEFNGNFWDRDDCKVDYPTLYV